MLTNVAQGVAAYGINPETLRAQREERVLEVPLHGILPEIKIIIPHIKTLDSTI